MIYKKDFYNKIFKVIQEKYGIKNEDLPGKIWIAWRVQVKRLFDKGILIKEILTALPEAEKKKYWPMRTAFWHRVEDVVLKNRREIKPAFKENKIESIKDLLSKRI